MNLISRKIQPGNRRNTPLLILLFELWHLPLKPCEMNSVVIMLTILAIITDTNLWIIPVSSKYENHKMRFYCLAWQHNKILPTYLYLYLHVSCYYIVMYLVICKESPQMPKFLP